MPLLFLLAVGVSAMGFPLLLWPAQASEQQWLWGSETEKMTPDRVRRMGWALSLGALAVWGLFAWAMVVLLQR